MPELEALLEVGTKHKLWTETEEQILRKYYGRIETIALATHLKRSRSSVQYKASSLGVSFDRG